MATKDEWIIAAVNDFVGDFPIGSKLTAKDLGNWMVEHNGIEAPETVDPNIRTNNATWVKYVRDRATLRAQLNRYSCTATYAAEGGIPYEIHHIAGEKYRVLAMKDDIRILMYKLLKKTKSGFQIKTNKIKRLREVAEVGTLNHNEKIRLERMCQDLNYTEGEVTRTLERALELLGRCDQDFITMAALGITNGNASPPAATTPSPEPITEDVTVQEESIFQS